MGNKKRILSVLARASSSASSTSECEGIEEKRKGSEREKEMKLLRDKYKYIDRHS